MIGLFSSPLGRHVTTPSVLRRVLLLDFLGHFALVGAHSRADSREVLGRDDLAHSQRLQQIEQDHARGDEFGE